MALGFLAQLGIMAAQAMISSVMSPDEQEQPQQMAGSLLQPSQLPQEAPAPQMGLPQPPQYGQQPPAITQFPAFKPLFGQQRRDY
jgi:hypothetical protein